MKIPDKEFKEMVADAKVQAKLEDKAEAEMLDKMRAFHAEPEQKKFWESVDKEYDSTDDDDGGDDDSGD
jgi:hypothetical protein